MSLNIVIVEVKKSENAKFKVPYPEQDMQV